MVRAGIAKINIDAAVKSGFRTVFIKAYSSENPLIDTRVPVAEGRSLAEAAVIDRIAMFGASQKAE